MARHQFIKCPHCQQVLRVDSVGNPQTIPKTFESTAQMAVEQQQPVTGFDWPYSEAVERILASLFAGGVLSALGWLMGADKHWYGVLVAVVMILIAVAPQFLKLFWYRPKFEQPEPKAELIKIQVRDETGEQTKILLHQIEDETIALPELVRVAVALASGSPMSRSEITQRARISKPKYRRILAEFRRLGFVFTAPNNVNVITLSGKHFIRELAKK